MSATLRWIGGCIAAGIGLLLLLPVLIIISIAIVLEDGRPVFFRQTRIGRNGAPFHLWKFRSMRTGTAGTKITAGGDPRITRVGAFLRRYKLDELPQLFNVLVGEMEFIGPRPEVPAFVDLQNPLWVAVLNARPGISDLATLVYRNEEEVLAAVPDPENYYRNVVLPDKLRLNLAYMRQRTLWQDVRLLALTVRYSFRPAGFHSDHILRQFSK